MSEEKQNSVKLTHGELSSDQISDLERILQEQYEQSLVETKEGEEKPKKESELKVAAVFHSHYKIDEEDDSK